MDLTGSDRSEVRRADRKPVAIRAQLRVAGTDKLDVELTNLSETGFQIATIYKISSATPIWLKLPGLSGLEAKVCWTSNDHYGCAFRNPLHPAVFDHVVSAAGRAV